MQNKIKSIIGITMDTYEMRALEVSVGDKPKIIAEAVIPLNKMVNSDGVFDSQDEIENVFISSLKEKGFSHAPIIIGLKHKNILMRMASFPYVEESKMKSVILLQAQQFIPVPVGDLVLDFVEYDRFKENDRDMINVLLVGAKKKLIYQLLSICGKYGSSVSNIDAGLLASVNAVCEDASSKNKTVLMAEVDNGDLDLAFVKNGTILFTRSIPLSSSNEDKDNMEETEEKFRIYEISEKIEKEIKSSIDYFQNLKPDDILEKIFVIGSNPDLLKIVEVLKNKITVPLDFPSVYENFNLTKEKLLPYISCIKLALGK